MRQRVRKRWERALARKREQAARSSGAPGQPPDGGASGVDPAAEHKLIAHERPQDVPDPRTKSSGHGKKTADKWNQ